MHASFVTGFHHALFCFCRNGGSRLWVVAAACLMLCSGCGLMRETKRPSFTSCPWPVSKQVSEILAITPLGTPREQAIKSLEAAGIKGSYGGNHSLYYADVWKREDAVWHINVTLLFDSEGRLYATQPDTQGKLTSSPATAMSIPAEGLPGRASLDGPVRGNGAQLPHADDVAVLPSKIDPNKDPFLQ